MPHQNDKPVYSGGSQIEQWADRLDRMPRTLRIVLILLITLELVVLASVVVDRLLIDQVYQGDVDPMTPALIAAGLGLVFYGIGWWAMVGFDSDPQKPWRASLSSVLYAATGGVGLVVMVMLALFGLALGYGL